MGPFLYTKTNGQRAPPLPPPRGRVRRAGDCSGDTRRAGGSRHPAQMRTPRGGRRAAPGLGEVACPRVGTAPKGQFGLLAEAVTRMTHGSHRSQCLVHGGRSVMLVSTHEHTQAPCTGFPFLFGDLRLPPSCPPQGPRRFARWARTAPDGRACRVSSEKRGPRAELGDVTAWPGRRAEDRAVPSRAGAPCPWRLAHEAVRSGSWPPWRCAQARVPGPSVVGRPVSAHR